VFLWRVFLVKPFAALSIVVCLATILSCVLLERRHPHQRSDRFLIGVLGLLSVYQGLRILQGIGILTISIGTKMDDAIELAITAFYLMAALVLRLSMNSHLDAVLAMRLARAEPPRSSRQIEHARDLPAIEILNWAMPRLSDGAFKVFAFLCMRADYTTGRVPVGAQDVRLQLGKTKDQLEAHLAELQSSGAVVVLREGNNLNIELLAHNRRAPDLSEEIPRSSITMATGN
jgi:hypothetical protein